MFDLRPGQRYRIRRDLRSTGGRLYPAGDGFRFTRAVYDGSTGDAELHGWVDDDTEVTFHTLGFSHGDFFEETAEAGRPLMPAAAPVEEPNEPTLTGDPRDDADTLYYTAVALARQRSPRTRDVAQRALNLYYSWMSQATSGGEGVARQSEVRSHLQDLERLCG